MDLRVNKNMLWGAFAAFTFFQIAVSALAQERTIAVVSPGDESNEFWGNVISLTRAAADDFGYRIIVHHAGDDADRFAALIDKATSGKETPKPDAVMFPNMEGKGAQLLSVAEKNGVPALTFNMGVDVNEAGRPRDRYKNWIGQLVPDDEEAGYLLAKKLIDAASESGTRNIEILAIAGRKTDTPSIDRIRGLKRAVAEYPGVSLNKVSYTNWTEKEAMDAASQAAQKTPAVSVFWCASDRMAIAVSNALRRAGREVNKNLFVGGIDWTSTGLIAVSENRLTATVGGHLIEGGWAVVLLHDYFNGKDFAGESTLLKTPMSVADASNIDQYLERLGENKWGQINFTLYSKTRSTRIDKYRFTLDTMLLQLR